MNAHFLLSATTLVGYLIAAALVWNSTRHRPGKQRPRAVLATISIALIFHIITLAVNPGINIQLLTALGPVISAAGLVATLIFVLLSSRNFSPALGLVVIPLAMLGVIAAMAIPITERAAPAPAQLGWHIALALPTYGIFSLAFAQACMLWFQDHRLRHPGAPDLLPGLPAIQSMESALYWLTLTGFALMTLNLILGMVSSQVAHGALLPFNHHIILSLAAWLGFGGLLYGRKTMGWRGRVAAQWTIAVFIVLVLAYFGTRFVRQIILAD